MDMKRFENRLPTIIWRAVLVLLIAKVSPAPAAAPAKATYEDHLKPLFRERCFSCHGPDRKSSGLRLNSFASVMMGGSSGQAVKPGDADGSLLYKLVTHQQEPHMPPQSPMLPKDSLDLIRAWIEGGALENAGSKAKVAAKPKLEMSAGAVVKGKPEGPPPMPGNLSLEPVTRSLRPNALVALAASPWAPLVAVGGQKQVLLYHSELLDLLAVLPFPEGMPCVLKFSRNGRLLLAGGGVGGKSGRVVVWDVVTGQRVFEIGEELDQALAADISADQTQIALGGPGKIVRVFSTRDGKLLYELKKLTDWVTALDFSPDGVLLATGDRAGNLFVWEAFTGREHLNLRGHTAGITDLSWRIDSNLVASASEDSTVRLWEVENGNQVKGWGGGAGLQSVCCAADGRLVTSGRDHILRIWDPNGTALRALPPLPDIATRAVFSHDGSRVIGGDWSGQVGVWSSADGRLFGHLDVTPAPLAERLAQANRDLPAREQTYRHLAAAAAASHTLAQSSAAELATARQYAADSAVAARIVAKAVAQAKQTVDQANASLTTATQPVTAREVTARAYAEATSRIKEAADKDKKNAELATALAKSQQIAAQAQTELTAAQKALAPVAAAAAGATSEYASVQRAAALTATTATAAAQALPQRETAAKAAAAKAAADKEAADAAATALAATRRLVERCTSAIAAKGKTK
jgi:hypothetical protein